MLQTLAGYNRIRQGLSYWHVKLNTGKEYTELQLDWTVLANNGDTGRIKEAILHTPLGDVRFAIDRPHSVIQLSQGVLLPLTGERYKFAQILGRIEGDGGICTSAIWDVLEQRLYTNHVTSVRNFKAWKPGIADIGGLALDPMGARI